MSKTQTTARVSNEVTTRFEGWSRVVITADSKTDAQATMRLVHAWVKANGGKSKLENFISAPRWSSNLDLFYRASIWYKLPATSQEAA